MRLSFFPGCSYCGTAKEYGESTLAVMAALGHELTEIPDWNCCGASSAHALDENLQYLLPLRNLVLGEGMGLEGITSSCSACYNVSKQAEQKMLTDDRQARKLNEEIEATTGRRYEGRVRVIHPLEVLSRPDELAKLRERSVRRLAGLKVVMYYGCYLSRPPEIVAFESAEQPVSMDKICEACGAEVRRWSFKVDCCGASLMIPRSSIVEQIVDRLISEAVHAGADALVTPCPMCLANLDARQKLHRARGEQPVPIFYYTELMAMSLGLPGLRRWLHKRLVDPAPLLRRVGLGGLITGSGRTPAATAAGRAPAGGRRAR